MISTFAQAFPDLDWGKLADVANDPETVGLTLIPPVTALITRPYPEPPESRIIAPEVLDKIYDAVDQCRPDDLPAGLSKRWAPVAGVPLSVISLRRSLDRGLALDRMIACGFLTEEAARILSEAVQGREHRARRTQQQRQDLSPLRLRRRNRARSSRCGNRRARA
jgi:hypothetical protein